MTANPKLHALKFLRAMLNAHAEFHPGQWEVIETVAIHRKRALIVQRTGWGKSLAYLLAARLLREQGSGPTLNISPLLSLMRNQIAMALSLMGSGLSELVSAGKGQLELRGKYHVYGYKFRPSVL